MKNKVKKMILTALPCIIVLASAGFAMAKPADSVQQESADAYDTQKLQSLVSEMAKKGAESELVKTTEKTKSTGAVEEYEDGTYYGTGTGFAGKIKVCVVVKEKKISSVEVVENEADDAAFLERAKGVITQVIESQSLEVDAVSGATFSSRGILEAIKNALTGEASSSTVASAAAQTAGSSAPPAVSDYDEPEEGYKDGTYTGEGTGFGGTIKVSVKIKKSKIKTISILEAAGETASYFEQAKAVIPQIIAAQSPKVDAVSGATFSSNGIMNAVQDALNKAVKDKSSIKQTETAKESENGSQAESQKQTESQAQTDPVEFEKPAAYKDGTYSAVSRGFRGDMTVTVTIKDGKITDIQVSAKDDEPFITNAKQLIAQIIQAQDVTGIDAVSGATYSSNGILNGVKSALLQAAVHPETAKETEKEEQSGTGSESGAGSESGTGSESETESEPGSSVSLYQDGSFTGTGPGYIYDIQATVTIVNGTISSITAFSVDDPDEEEWMFMAKDPIVGAVLKNQGTGGVDAVSGATYTSKGLIAAINSALAQAEKKGE